MRVVFWGTPKFALPAFRALVGEGHDVVAAVTQPDRPSGRGRTMQPSPIKQAALDERIPVMTPERPRGQAFLDTLEALDPEISVVVAYGHILRPEVLEIPERGSINVHASMLPELRGAAPINWALVRGYESTGVTVMQMTEGMDAGPILLQREIPIGEDDTASELLSQLAELGAEALIEALALLEVDALEAVEQDDEGATYAPKLDREAARIDWSRSADQIANHVRGMDAVPGAWSLLRGEPVKLFRPRLRPVDSEHSPGTLVSVEGDGLVVKAGDGGILFTEAQPAGRNRMRAPDWLRGASLSVGERFE